MLNGISIQPLLMGALQGITEFLPVSSSGHLALMQIFFDFSGPGMLAFDLVLHCATMLAVLIFFRRDIALILKEWLRGLVASEARTSDGWRYGWFVLAGTIVTAMIGLPLKDTAEMAMNHKIAVGGGFLITSVLLFLTPLFPVQGKKLSLKIALIVGLVQGIAVFPGVSRSGSTIMAALALGVSADSAFRFSFLLSIPAIAGASLIEIIKVMRSSEMILPVGWLVGAVVAFILGWSSLVLLRRLVISGRWAYFGLYCFVLGILTVVTSVAASF